MEIIDYLDKLEKQNENLYKQTNNLISLVYATGKCLRCTSEELKFLYNISALFYITDISKDFKQEQKIIKAIKLNKNFQCANYMEHKLQLIIIVCEYYNSLRQTLSHTEAMKKIDKHQNLPQIVKMGFEEAIKKYDLINEVEF